MNAFSSIKFTQEKVVVLVAITTFVIFSIFLTGFFSTSNLIGLVRNVSVLGILGVGMGIVIIGRGVDLSVVSILAISAAYFIELLNAGVPMWSSFVIVLGLVLLVGAISGFSYCLRGSATHFYNSGNGTVRIRVWPVATNGARCGIYF